MIDEKKIRDAADNLAKRLGYVQVVLPDGKAIEGLYQTPERAAQVRAGNASPWGRREQVFRVWVNCCALWGGIRCVIPDAKGRGCGFVIGILNGLVRHADMIDRRNNGALGHLDETLRELLS